MDGEESVRRPGRTMKAELPHIRQTIDFGLNRICRDLHGNLQQICNAQWCYYAACMNRIGLTRWQADDVESRELYRFFKYKGGVSSVLFFMGRGGRMSSINNLRSNFLWLYGSVCCFVRTIVSIVHGIHSLSGMFSILYNERVMHTYVLRQRAGLIQPTINVAE